MLVLDFESRSGEMLNFFCQNKNGSTAGSAYSVGRHDSTRVDEGRKRLNLFAIKMQGTDRRGEGEKRGKKSLCYVTPDLSSMTTERKKCEDNKLDEKKTLKFLVSRTGSYAVFGIFCSTTTKNSVSYTHLTLPTTPYV